MVRTILASYLGVCAYVILLLQALSPVRWLTFWPVLAGLIAPLLILVWLAGRGARHLAPARSLVAFLHPVALPFALVLPPLAVLLVVQGWHFAPNDWDAMTYHLARAAYWRQYHSLAPYLTNSWHQVSLPGNVETLFAALLVLTHGGRLIFLVEFVAYVMTGLAIHGIARQAGASAACALFGAGLFCTLPEVVLQSNSSTIELSVASFVLCALYFLGDLLQTRASSSLFWLLIAGGLALGAKPTPALALPGLAIGLILLVRGADRGAWPIRRWARAACLALAPTLALAAPWYVENIVRYGSWSGPAVIAHLQLVPHPTLHTLRVNLLRHLLAFLDPVGPVMIVPSMEAGYCNAFTSLHGWLAGVLRIDATDPTVDWPWQPYQSFPICYFNQLLTWYGLTGALALWAALAWAAIGAARARLNMAWLCAAGAVSYLLLDSLVLRWQRWEGHLLTTLLALCCPAAAMAAQALVRWRGARWLLCLVALYAAASGPTAAVLNNGRPLSAWNERYNARLTTVQYAGYTPLFDAVDQYVPAASRLGILLPTDAQNGEWEFPFFGRNLTRTVIPIAVPASINGGFAGGPAYHFAGPFDYLLTHVPGGIVASLFATIPDVRCTPIWEWDGWYAGPYVLYRCAPATVP